MISNIIRTPRQLLRLPSRKSAAAALFSSLFMYNKLVEENSKMIRPVNFTEKWKLSYRVSLKLRRDLDLGEMNIPDQAASESLSSMSQCPMNSVTKRIFKDVYTPICIKFGQVRQSEIRAINIKISFLTLQ